MPRPIVLTEDIKQKARDDFSAMLDCIRDGKITYSENFCYKECNVIVWFTSEAYSKTLALLTEFSDEAGWHGTVSRLNDNEFVIEDIFVYPQEVTGSTVNTDQKAYTEWLYGLDDEVFTKLRLQGHSHVNMGVSPSGVDENHRKRILEQLDQDMFYIYMIWNKSLSVNTVIYDMENNILYENKDIEVKLLCGEGIDKFLADAKEKVKKKVASVKKAAVKKTEYVRDEKYDDDLAMYVYYPYMSDQFDLGGNIWL